MQHYIRYWDEEGRTNSEILEALFKPSYAKAVDEEMRYLFRAYGIEPRFGRAHPAPCSAWRSERTLDSHQVQKEARFANRIHIFEGKWPENLGGKSTIDQEPGSVPENLRRTPFIIPDATQRYLGYVSLRPRSYEAFDKHDKRAKFHLRYTSVAVLAPPPFMMRPRYHLITCMAGPADGVLPFRAVPYCSPDSRLAKAAVNGPGPNKAPCMHAALHSSLLLKSNNYQCRPISSQDMIALLWELDHTNRIRLNKDEEGNDETPHETYSRWNEKGLSLEQSLSILRHPEVCAGGILEEISTPGPLAGAFNTKADPEKAAEHSKKVSQRALRCLLDYIGNGVPVVMEVRPDPDKEEGDQTIQSPESSHAIMVFGYHLLADPDDDRWPLPDDDTAEMQRVDFRELPTRFVLHDGFFGPYYVKSVGHLLKKAWTQDPTLLPEISPSTTEVKQSSVVVKHPQSPGIRFVAVLPHGARIGIEDVREFALKEALFPSAYLREQLRFPSNLVNAITNLPPAEVTVGNIFENIANEIQKWVEAPRPPEDIAETLATEEARIETEMRKKLSLPSQQAARTQAQQELSWMVLFEERSLIPRLVTRLLKPHQILGRYLVDRTGCAMGPGQANKAYDIVHRALMTYQQWYNYCLRPVDSPSPLYWWVVEVRSPFQPLVRRGASQYTTEETVGGGYADEDAGAPERSCPAHVFCWPIITPASRHKNKESQPSGASGREGAGRDMSQAAITFTYEEGQRAKVITRYYPVEELFSDDETFKIDHGVGKTPMTPDESLVAQTDFFFQQRRQSLVEIVAKEGNIFPWKWEQATYNWGVRDA